MHKSSSNHSKKLCVQMNLVAINGWVWYINNKNLCRKKT